MNQVDFFKALSDSTRLSILKMIQVHQSVCVYELTQNLQITQPTASRHLALLRNLSIVIDERLGQWVYYRINPDLPTWGHDILNILAKKSSE